MATGPIDHQIQPLVAGKNWSALSATVENYELDACNEKDEASPYYTVLILANLLQGELENARFVWKRAPKDSKAPGTSICAAWEIGKAMWQRDYAKVYTAMAAFKGSKIEDVCCAHLRDTVFRESVCKLLGKGFSTISTKEASVYLGLAPAEVSKYCSAAGWEKLEGDMWKPTLNLKPNTETSHLTDLKPLAKYIVHLEQQ
mmetsp:Transcript_18444/g.20510  ORF Transcript_18444/g.20510 Transcript_18444/m.20510 type:complete len:201 (+) Transcript_18444:21-623(+)